MEPRNRLKRYLAATKVVTKYVDTSILCTQCGIAKTWPGEDGICQRCNDAEDIRRN